LEFSIFSSLDPHILTSLHLHILVVLQLFQSGVSGQPAAQATVVDRSSSVKFPVVLVPPGGGSPHQLTGTATRERTILRVNVYAYGLYVDGEAARANLSAFSGRPTALDRDPAFLQRLLEMRVPMTLRLVTTRDLAGDALVGAFDEALKPRVQRAATELKMTGGEAALERFRAYFNLRELADGTEIVFSCAGGRLKTTVGGQARPEIESPALCRALFDVYLGTAPISRDGRRSLIEGFPSLLAGSR
jgi:hypothetical protein